jgi:hypothetical protein
MGGHPSALLGAGEALPYANINGGCCNDPSPSMGEGGPPAPLPARRAYRPEGKSLRLGEGEGDILGRPDFSPSAFQAFAFPGGMGMEWKF